MEPLTPRAREALAAYRDEHALSPEARRRLLERLAAGTRPGSAPDTSHRPRAARARLRWLHWLAPAGVASLALLGGVLGALRDENRLPPVAPSAALATPVETPRAAHESAPEKPESAAQPQREHKPATPLPERARKRAPRRVRGGSPAAAMEESDTTRTASRMAAHENESLREPSPAQVVELQGDGDDRATTNRAVRQHPLLPERSLDAEVALLRRVRELMAGGDPLRALAALGEHARLFPDGKLADMREVARIEALCELGRVEQAAREAVRFVQRYSDSPYAARARRGCANP